jgi:hypothetical protein
MEVAVDGAEHPEFGEFPAFRFARTVRSEGRDFKAALAGPSPLPSAPWHAAQ